MTDAVQELWDVECCSGTGHTIRDGGSHINIMVLNKKAFSRFMVAHDFWLKLESLLKATSLDGKERPPRAFAVLCDTCRHEKREPFWAVGKDENGGPIYRVPVCELGDWVFEEQSIR